MSAAFSKKQGKAEGATTLSFKVSKSLLARIDLAAAEDYRNRSNWIRRRLGEILADLEEGRVQP